MTSFEYKDHTYLAVENQYNGKYNINSALFKWVQKQGQKDEKRNDQESQLLMQWSGDLIVFAQ